MPNLHSKLPRRHLSSAAKKQTQKASRSITALTSNAVAHPDVGSHPHRNPFFSPHPFCSRGQARSQTPRKKSPIHSIGPRDPRCLSWLQTSTMLEDLDGSNEAVRALIWEINNSYRENFVGPSARCRRSPTHHAHPQNRSPGKPRNLC